MQGNYYLFEKWIIIYRKWKNWKNFLPHRGEKTLIDYRDKLEKKNPTTSSRR